MNLRLPSITGATVGERLEQVVRYLFSLVNDLNFTLGQREQEKLQQTAESERTEGNNRLRPKSVTTDILADGAVTNDKIADGTIDKSKLSFSTDLIAGSGITVEGRKISTAAAPYNLLDNSDFSNPVNQRGQATYSGGYWIDRWIASAYASIKTDCINITAVSGMSGIEQRLENPSAYNGKKLTLAVCAKSGGLLVLSFPFVGAITGIQTTNEWKVYTYTVTFQTNQVNAVDIFAEAGSDVDIKWAAVYEGEYTADTLPAYQPKGYAVELAECQRYYRFFDYVTASIPGDAYIWLSLNFSPMRALPTFSTGALYGGDNQPISGASIDGANISKTGVTTLHVTGNNGVPVYMVSGIALNADL